MRNQYWIVLLAGFLSFSAIAQEVPNQSPLTIAQIMAGEDFTGYSPNQISWSEDGQWIYFMWNPERDTLRSLYKVSPSGGAPEKVSEAEIKDLPGDGEYNRDHTFKVYEKYGDLFLLNLTDGTTRTITQTLERESAPRFSGDESGVIFERDDNLFRWDRTTGGLIQLTNFQKGSPRPEPSLSEQDKWLERDQMELFEVLRWREAVDKKKKARSESRQPDRPKPYYLGGKQLSNLRLSPDGHFATFRLTRRT
ncbi:MAG: S9 family peptidase, partial [Bacteroidetes bacterium]